MPSGCGACSSPASGCIVSGGLSSTLRSRRPPGLFVVAGLHYFRLVPSRLAEGELVQLLEHGSRHVGVDARTGIRLVARRLAHREVVQLLELRRRGLLVDLVVAFVAFVSHLLPRPIGE